MMNNKKGYTLIESLVYITIFLFVSVIIIELILSVLETHRQVTPINTLSREAVSSLEQLTREIRGATSVDMANSVFATSSGSLQLNTTNQTGDLRTVKFYLDLNKVKIDDNGLYLGPLSSDLVTVTSLIFNLATSTKQDLVKIELSLTAGSGDYQKSETFYSAVKLRTDN